MKKVYIDDSVPIDNLITQETIDNLRRPVFSLIDNIEVTNYIFEFCRKLLVFAKERHNSKEMAYAINMSTLDFIGSAFGDLKSIDITPLIRLMNDKNHMFIVIHNHPSNNPFSPRDLNTFFSTSNMMILVVIGNSGAIYVLEKCSSISNEDYNEIKKLIIKYRQGKISFEDITLALTNYNVVFSNF